MLVSTRSMWQSGTKRQQGKRGNFSPHFYLSKLSEAEGREAILVNLLLD